MTDQALAQLAESLRGTVGDYAEITAGRGGVNVLVHYIGDAGRGEVDAGQKVFEDVGEYSRAAERLGLDVELIGSEHDCFEVRLTAARREDSAMKTTHTFIVTVTKDVADALFQAAEAAGCSVLEEIAARLTRSVSGDPTPPLSDEERIRKLVLAETTRVMLHHRDEIERIVEERARQIARDEATAIMTERVDKIAAALNEHVSALSHVRELRSQADKLGGR